MKTTAIVLMLALGLAGCSGSPAGTPLAPSPAPSTPATPIPVTLAVFTDDASGFSTSDVRDAHDRIVRFNTAAELILTADDRRFPGYQRQGSLANVIDAQKLCQCWFEVRFGSVGGDRRAYLTADYGHSNPGTVVDLDVVSGALIMTQSVVYPPGTYTMSGVITEATAAGPVPIEGAEVWRLYGGGWQLGTTDKTGRYEIHGLYDGVWKVGVDKEGYDALNTVVTMHGDTRFDTQLVRR